jgi:hypothetical protein
MPNLKLSKPAILALLGGGMVLFGAVAYTFYSYTTSTTTRKLNPSPPAGMNWA